MSVYDIAVVKCGTWQVDNIYSSQQRVNVNFNIVYYFLQLFILYVLSISYNAVIRITLVRYEINSTSHTNSCGMFKKKFRFPQIRSFLSFFYKRYCSRGTKNNKIRTEDSQLGAIYQKIGLPLSCCVAVYMLFLERFKE